MEVEYDMESTQDMEDVAFTPLGKSKAKSTIRNAFPDSGCEQSLISEDLIKSMGLVLENKKKRIEAVDGSVVRCSGSTAIKVEYQGHEAHIRALVTPALKDEVILSKKTLKKLSVLPKDFPNAQPVQVRVVKDSKNDQPNEWSEECDLEEEVRKLKETYKEVFDDEGELKPMLSDPCKIERGVKLKLKITIGTNNLKLGRTILTKNQARLRRKIRKNL